MGVCGVYEFQMESLKVQGLEVQGFKGSEDPLASYRGVKLGSTKTDHALASTLDCRHAL
jgi:hypothetical protein